MSILVPSRTAFCLSRHKQWSREALLKRVNLSCSFFLVHLKAWPVAYIKSVRIITETIIVWRYERYDFLTWIPSPYNASELPSCPILQSGQIPASAKLLTRWGQFMAMRHVCILILPWIFRLHRLSQRGSLPLWKRAARSSRWERFGRELPILGVQPDQFIC